MSKISIVPRPEKYLAFTVLGTPQPQGSMKAFVVKGKARMTSANAQMKPWRQEVGQMALAERARQGCHSIWAGRHVPVVLTCDFCFAKPKSAPKSRKEHVVKPDLDKLVRSVGDALKGILWEDDGQIVSITATKLYRLPERVEIRVWVVQE